MWLWLLLLLASCGSINPQRTKVVEVRGQGVTLDSQKLQDPPGINNIDIGGVKCEIRSVSGQTVRVCVYGIEVIDSDRKVHRKYYTCFVSRDQADCRPIELFKG